ncbi:MAG: hypothetical protein K6F99_00105, partial [Lachnospiraceae bacterium]|nr:hypothetical protein [Lachnospiraceae bacterium]
MNIRCEHDLGLKIGKEHIMKTKKMIPALLAVFPLPLSTACGSGEGTQNRTANKQSGVEDVLAQG